MKTVLVTSNYEQARGKPMPSKNHAIIQSNLHFELRKKYHAQFQFLLEIHVDLGKNSRIPDIGIYASLAYTPGNDEAKVTEIPLGVVEILSSSQSLSELIQKSSDYFEAGVKSYWLVLPDLKTIYVFHAPGEYEVFAKEAVLKDTALHIELNLVDIFRS